MMLLVKINCGGFPTHYSVIKSYPFNYQQGILSQKN